MKICFAGILALRSSKTLKGFQKTMDTVLTTKKSILLCNDTDFLLLFSGVLEAVDWNRVQMWQVEPPHLQHDELSSCMTFRLRLQKCHSELGLKM